MPCRYLTRAWLFCCAMLFYRAQALTGLVLASLPCLSAQQANKGEFALYKRGSCRKSAVWYCHRNTRSSVLLTVNAPALSLKSRTAKQNWGTHTLLKIKVLYWHWWFHKDPLTFNCDAIKEPFFFCFPKEPFSELVFLTFEHLII